MQTYRNDLFNNYMWWEMMNIQRDFSGYTESLDFTLEEVTGKEYQVQGGYPCYFTQGDESGVIIWWADLENEGVAYNIPDGVSFDLTTGKLTSDEDFTVQSIVISE